MGGYAGFGKLIALPFNTPPEIGARCGVGEGFAGGGSEVSIGDLAGVGTLRGVGDGFAGDDPLLFSTEGERSGVSISGEGCLVAGHGFR